MNNLLPTEWNKAIDDAASRVRAMWPEITVEVDDGIIVLRSIHVHSTMTLDARISADRTHLIAVPLPGGGAGLPNNMVDARAYHMSVGRMLDALTMAAACMSGLRLYLDEAPCEPCSGKGKSRGETCSTCNGEGVRREP